MKILGFEIHTFSKIAKHIQCLEQNVRMWASIHKTQTLYITSLCIILSPYGGSIIVTYVILEKKMSKKQINTGEDFFFLKNLVLNMTKVNSLMYVLTCIMHRLDPDLCKIRFRDLQNKYIYQDTRL